jgi:hypothetical protein
MSASTASDDLFNYLAETSAVHDAEFRESLDMANDILGVEGTTIRLLQATPVVGVSDLVDLLFFVKTEGNLQLWQLVEYEVAHRRFKSRSVTGPRGTYGVPAPLFGRLPFVCRSNLTEVVTKVGDVSRFPLPDCILGLTVRDLDGGGREFAIGKSGDTFVTFVQPPVEAALQVQVPAPHAQDPFKSAAVRVIPVTTASVLFTGMLEHPSTVHCIL